MHRVPFLCYLLMFVSLFVTGCDLLGSSEEDESSVEEEGLLLGTMTANVDGSDWEATGGAGAIRYVGPLEGSLAISGMRGNEESSITLGIFNPRPEEESAFEVTPGTYAIGEDDGGAAEYVRASTDGTETVYQAADGRIVVEAIDAESIRGTFQFYGRATGGSEVVVTEGAFDVEFATP